MGSEAAASGTLAAVERPHPAGREYSRVPVVELDGARRVALHRRRADPGRPTLFRQGTRRDRSRQLAHRRRAAIRSAPARRSPRARHVPHAVARVFAVHRRGAVDRRYGSEDHRRTGARPSVGASAPRHRSRSGRLDGAQETGRVFLMPDLLRMCTAGSVDDGKSTLIGRLLYDSRGVYEDQIHSVTAASRNRGAGPIDFSLFTDGLRAEREQGITIDVAYRYFATARQKFTLADTPGHEQYTRNMATGASTADVATPLADARHGVGEQTRRHARIA